MLQQQQFTVKLTLAILKLCNESSEFYQFRFRHKQNREIKIGRFAVSTPYEFIAQLKGIFGYI